VAAGAETGARGALRVDRRMRTNLPDVLAAGDCVETYHRLLGAQLVGHKDAEVAKRIDIPAGALFHGMTVDGLNDLDLSYTPPFGSPWDAIQLAAHDWAAMAAQAAR